MGFPCRRVQTQAGGVEIWADGNHRLDKKAINEEEAERIFMLMFVNLNASFWPVVPKGNTYPPVCGVEICKGVKSSSRVDLGVGRLFFKLVPTLLRLCEWWQRCSEWGRPFYYELPFSRIFEALGGDDYTICYQDLWSLKEALSVNLDCSLPSSRHCPMPAIQFRTNRCINFLQITSW